MDDEVNGAKPVGAGGLGENGHMADMFPGVDVEEKARRQMPADPTEHIAPPQGGWGHGLAGAIMHGPLPGKSVVQEPLGYPLAPLGDFIFTYATVADDLPAWGTQIAGRDREIRRFWPTEPVTASAVYTTSSKYAGIGWHLEGPPRTVGIYQRMLNTIEWGQGWQVFLMKFLNDYFTQDNGAFIEIVRSDDDPRAPCVSLNVLDSNRCVRTGLKATPVIYYDIRAQGHLLRWYQVIPISEFPSPIEFLRGLGFCAITRLLRAAQIMRDISVYKREKVSGRFNRGMYLVSGVQQKSIDNMLRDQSLRATSEGMTRYVHPIVIASLDPGATVKVDQIDFAKLPDNFDEDHTMRWYIAQLALAFGGDYQDFAPLPAGNLGTAAQSRMLHTKALNKGSRLFTALMEQIMNYRGILPTNVRYVYGEPDVDEDNTKAQIRLTRAKERQVRILSGEITVAVARQIAADAGDLEYDYMLKLNEKPISPDVDIMNDNPVSANPELEKVDDPAAYEGTPEEQVVPSTNAWGGPGRGGAAAGQPSEGAGAGGAH